MIYASYSFELRIIFSVRFPQHWWWRRLRGAKKIYGFVCVFIKKVNYLLNRKYFHALLNRLKKSQDMDVNLRRINVLSCRKRKRNSNEKDMLNLYEKRLFPLFEETEKNLATIYFQSMSQIDKDFHCRLLRNIEFKSKI